MDVMIDSTLVSPGFVCYRQTIVAMMEPRNAGCNSICTVIPVGKEPLLVGSGPDNLAAASLEFLADLAVERVGAAAAQQDDNKHQHPHQRELNAIDGHPITPRCMDD